MKSKKRLFNNVLVVGLGSTASTLIPLLGKLSLNVIGYTRKSKNGNKAIDELKLNKGQYTSKGMINLVGQLSSFYLDLEELAMKEKIKFDCIFLCIQNQYYAEIVSELNKKGLINVNAVIVGISSRLGSAYEIQKKLGSRDDINIVSFSVYYGATKFIGDSRTISYTKGIKNKVYVGATKGFDKNLKSFLSSLLSNVGTKIIYTKNLLEAEIQNNNLYGHSQFTIFDDILKDIFSLNPKRKYLYREEPEGCLSARVIEQVVGSSEEINQIFLKLNLNPPNILKLFVKDMYVIKDFAPEEVIKNYPKLLFEQKCELIYKYFLRMQKSPKTGESQLEAVALPRAQIINNKYIIPRIPGEDYCNIVLLVKIAELLNLDVPDLKK